MTDDTRQREATPNASEDLVQAVRDRYAGIATGVQSSCCTQQTSCCGAPADTSARLGYRPEELQQLPEGADLGLGCGAPLAALTLTSGETVLDLGSGAGIDVILASRMVGAEGRVIGVDMTAEMIDRARQTVDNAGADNVELRQGRLESLPLDDASVDAVTSNCVINLVPDKAAVFREVARVLRPGGRMAVSDIVLDRALPEIVSSDLMAYVGCVAGAIDRTTYFDTLRSAGMTDITIVRDIDFLAVAGDSLPAEIEDLLERTGVSIAELKGTVRSVTYVARKQG